MPALRITPPKAEHLKDMKTCSVRQRHKCQYLTQVCLLNASRALFIGRVVTEGLQGLESQELVFHSSSKLHGRVMSLSSGQKDTVASFTTSIR